VGRTPKDVTGPRIEKRITKGGEVKEVLGKKRGKTLRRNYYRVVEGYRPSPED
jgi:hypothetical protein